MTPNITDLRMGEDLLKRGFAKMTKGGVVMDVTTVEQARVAESAGAVAVMALERVPADIRAAGGVARMADPNREPDINFCKQIGLYMDYLCDIWRSFAGIAFTDNQQGFQ